MTQAEKAHKAWEERPYSTEPEPHSYRCQCRRCQNLAKGKRLLSRLRELPPERFASVEDLAYVAELCSQNCPLPDGTVLEQIEKSLRKEAPRG